MRICDYCKKECKKTPFGSCVILCRVDIILCLDCHFKKLENDKLKKRYKNFLSKNKILDFLRKREYNINFNNILD